MLIPLSIRRHLFWHVEGKVKVTIKHHSVCFVFEVRFSLLCCISPRTAHTFFLTFKFPSKQSFLMSFLQWWDSVVEFCSCFPQRFCLLAYDVPYCNALRRNSQFRSGLITQTPGKLFRDIKCFQQEVFANSNLLSIITEMIFKCLLEFPLILCHFCFQYMVNDEVFFSWLNNRSYCIFTLEGRFCLYENKIKKNL